jgi:hypothetical protein
MKLTQWLVTGGMAGCLASAPAAFAQSGLDGELLKMYGGAYSGDCGNASATRLRVTARELLVEQGSKRLAGKNLEAAHSFFGNSAPPNYMVALMSEVQGGSQMIFIVHREGPRQYIKVDGDQRVTTALGKNLLSRKFYHCDADQRQAAAPAPIPSAAPPAAAEPQSPPDLLRNPKFRAAYFKALGPKSKEGWLTTLDGPAQPLKRVRVGGAEYIMASVCKPHDCADNNTVLLYSALNGAVYGKIFDRRRATLIGAPPAAVATELDRLWASEWRK